MLARFIPTSTIEVPASSGTVVKVAVSYKKFKKENQTRHIIVLCLATFAAVRFERKHRPSVAQNLSQCLSKGSHFYEYMIYSGVHIFTTQFYKKPPMCLGDDFGYLYPK